MKKNICFLAAWWLAHLAADAQKSPDGLVIPPFKAVEERKPAFPLKTSRSLYTDEELRQAQHNIARFSSAGRIREAILKKADYWVGLSNDEILAVMPDARVPRGFDLCPKGCPAHGDSVFKVGGFYPWKIDPKKPLQVTCPIGGETYPSNDYAEYYQSGFTNKGNGDYADDGWGWISPQGDRYWFVAYANQWMWYDHTIPGLLSLAQAYSLTGEHRYAEKATLMLYRLAEIYPSMDHENQSRYGLMEKMKGNVYSGKILNRIWETQLVRNVAEAYDYVWDYIDRDSALQQFAQKTGAEIRAFIEANVLEDALDAIDQKKIAGNFGMHQNAMLYLHLVRQNAGKEAAIDKMTDEPSPQMAQNGFRYALYNQVFRDGMPLESPGYNAHWVKELVGIADVLKKGNRNLFDARRFKQLFDAPLDIVSIGRYTPDWGDGGSAIGGLTARYADTYQIGFQEYQDTRYLNWIGKTGSESFTTFNSLFKAALPEAPALAESRPVAPQKSRLFAGYGLGILNNPNDRTALALTYGIHYSHYHWDFLNIELFANGQKMMPDLGYPDAMNTYVSPVYTWSSNTISHNTVVVDERKQLLNLPGKLHNFYDGRFARIADASSPAYPNTSQYRRNLVMIDTGPTQSYVVDFFHVVGGRQHDYSLHGPPGEFIARSGEWSAPKPGTLAGENIALEELYDDENLKNNGSQRGYAGYRGSGFQHLFNVRNKVAGDGMVEYHHLNDPTARLRLHSLTPDLSDLFVADAYDRPRARAYRLNYVVARRKSADEQPLRSTFVSVFEPYLGDSALIRKTQLLRADKGNGHFVVIDREKWTDLVLHDTTASEKKIKRFQLETDAVNAIVTVNRKGQPERIMVSEGTYLKIGKRRFNLTPVTGVVSQINIENRELVIDTNSGEGTEQGDRIVHFRNAYRETVHPVEVRKSGNGQLTLKTKDDLLVGKLRADGRPDESVISTKTSLSFQKQYNGVTALNHNFAEVATVKRIENGKIELNSAPSMPIAPNDVLWLSNVGVGDEVLIKAGLSWEKNH